MGDGRLKEVSLNISVLILMLKFVAETTLGLGRSEVSENENKWGSRAGEQTYEVWSYS